MLSVYPQLRIVRRAIPWGKDVESLEILLVDKSKILWSPLSNVALMVILSSYQQSAELATWLKTFNTPLIGDWGSTASSS